MKKVLSIVLAIAMIATMSAVAFAAEGSVAAESENATGSAAFDVNGKFTAAAHVDKYKVDVTWTDTEFTYTEAATKWNTQTHKWDETNASSWAGEGTITVKNHSSKAVTATPSWAAAVEGVVVSFEGESALGACPVDADDAAVPSTTFSAKVTAGAITAETAGKIGTITVTIA